MYDGMFKCTDGYDPDTDPSLHPPGQDAKIRMLVNARAQKEHDEKVAAEKGEKSESDKPTTKSENSGKSADSPLEPDKSSRDDKTGDKKADSDKKGDGSKKASDKKGESEKSAAAKKGDEDKKADSGKREKSEQPKESYNPLKDAIFAMQTGKFQSSVELLTHFIAANAKNVEAHYILAVDYVSLRRYQDAAEQYRLVLKLAPGSKIAELASQGLKQIGN